MSDQKAKRFTIDEDKTGAKMPDINSLLYAKNSTKSKGSENDESLDPTVSMDISRAKLDEITRQSDVIEAPTKQSSYSVEASTSDASALQNPGQIELGDYDGSLSIEAATQVAPEGPPPSSAPVELAANPNTPPKRFAPPATGEVVISTFQKSASAPQGTPTGAQKAAIRKTPSPHSAGPILKHCEKTTLDTQTTAVSYGSGIKTLFERAKITSAIVFNKSENGFIADQVIGAAERANLWRGMEIVEKDLPDLYNRLNKYGYSEFSTLGVSGAGNFERTGFRTAFGVDRSEFVTMVKVGSGKDMDAIVVTFSAQSIATQIPFFHTALMDDHAPMKKAA